MHCIGKSDLHAVQCSRSQTQENTLANAWWFPLMLRWTYRATALQPFIDAGPNFQKISGIKRVSINSNPPSELANDFTTGVSAGAGFVVVLGRMRLEPELRFTHWGSRTFEDAVRSALRMNLNQADFLLGVTF